MTKSISLLKVSDVRSSEGLAADSWSDKHKSTKGQSKLEEDLAAQFGYTQNTWDSSRVAGMGSMSGWGALGVPTGEPQQVPPPPPPAPSQTTASEAEQWGYTAKPYIPPPIPITMPLLANPAAMHIPPPPQPMVPPMAALNGAHLVIENIPPDLNMMPLIYEHFKQFGEVVAVHCIQKHNKSLVDFRTREIAEVAASQPILGVPTIRASVFSGPARGPRGPGGMSQRPALMTSPGGTPASGGLTKNLVLESDAAKRAREKREQQAAMDKKRQEILQSYTEHVKMIVAKLADKSLPEETREKYANLLESVKAKISDLQKEESEKRRKEAEASQKAIALRYKAYEKQVRAESSRRQQELTLDLRSRCVKISDLPEELSQSIVLVEYLRAMEMKDLDEVIWLEDRRSAVLRFASHAAADSLVKHELAFKAEWVTNDAAQELANYNPVEKVEITPLGDDDEEQDIANILPNTAQ
jgi:hypothetical protein